MVRHLPWVDGLSFGILGNLEEVRDFEIRFCRGWRPHQEGLVHGGGMLGEFVRLRVHSHSPDAESVHSPCYSAGDLASISDKNFVEHLACF